MDDPLPALDELLRGPIAQGVLRSLMRDQERQMRENGAGVAVWALPVYRALQEASGTGLDRTAVTALIGPRVAAGDPTNWRSVTEAAASCGRSERQVRRLASSGAVTAKRLGHRSWLIDVDSLENVLRRRAA
jgi:hypothetical protein